MKTEQIVLDEIKKIIQDFTLDCSQKQIAHKVGFEEVYWITWGKNWKGKDAGKSFEYIFSRHNFLMPKIQSPFDTAQEIFFEPLKNALNNSNKLGELKNSWWKRIKFIFFK